MMEAVSGGRGSVVVEGGGRVIRGFRISLDGIEGGTYNKLNRLIVHQANLFSKKKNSTISQQKFTPKDTTSSIHCVSAVEDFYCVMST